MTIWHWDSEDVKHEDGTRPTSCPACEYTVRKQKWTADDWHNYKCESAEWHRIHAETWLAATLVAISSAIKCPDIVVGDPSFMFHVYLQSANRNLTMAMEHTNNFLQERETLNERAALD